MRWARTRAGPGRVRVTPQLIAVGDDSHLWAGDVRAALGEVFRLQSEIAERVTSALDVALAGAGAGALAAAGTRNAARRTTSISGVASTWLAATPGSTSRPP